MTLLYNIGIAFLQLGFHIASLFSAKAKASIAGRKDLIRKIQKALQNQSGQRVWIHCASLGEFEQGRPVIEALRKEFGALKVLITFFSPSGYEVRKNYKEADHVFYLPWDTARNASEFIAAANPTVAIFVKYEFWYHYSSELKARGIPTISISSIFRPEQAFFKPQGGFYRRILTNFDHFFVQNKASQQLLKSIGIDQCTVAGDTRFDRVYAIAQDGGEIPIAKAFKADQKTMVAGSCWPEDVEALTPMINEGKTKFILAPHEITETFLKQVEQALRVKSIRYSMVADQRVEDYQVLIIDNIGLLSRLYRYGEFAFVGGAFGKGLHNILEAACYGIPIFFGNKSYERFQEARDLIERGGAFAVGDQKELKEKFEMVSLPENFLPACEITRAYVVENLGATEKIMEYCRKVLR
ncbi:MAG TPA: glycosyltransferase N-terminal domain-containing protein [Chryseolinea sp.]